jgi:hypothetical protein
MRLPGFYHCKHNPVEVLAWYDVTTRYTIEEIMRAHPPVRAVDLSPARKSLADRFERKCQELAVAQTGRNDLLYRVCLLGRDAIAAGDMIGTAVVDRLEASCTACGLLDDEHDKTLATIERALSKSQDIASCVHVDDHGVPISSLGNVINLLLATDGWREAVAYDVRADRAVVICPLPALPGLVPLSGDVPRPLRDSDAADLAAWLSARHRMRLDGGTALHALVRVAETHPVDPVVVYLDSLVWDGVARIDAWLMRYCGVDDAPFARIVGSKWLISAVARAYDPGCRVDTTLVLEGRQGSYKSSAIQILASDRWYGSLSTLDDEVRAKMALQGVWIEELEELGALRASAEFVKKFLTERWDRYVPKYGRLVVDRPRRCVFVGTTNDSEYLTDPTGNRRIWPVHCGTIDIEALTVDRDQLWAEAVVRYHGGGAWHLSSAEETLASDEQEDRIIQDALEDQIGEALIRGVRSFELSGGWAIAPNATAVSTQQILEHIVHDRGDKPRSLQMRIATAMIRLGWSRVRHSGSRYGGRGWRRVEV